MLEKKCCPQYSGIMKNQSMQALTDLLNTAASWAYGRPTPPLNADDMVSPTIHDQVSLAVEQIAQTNHEYQPQIQAAAGETSANGVTISSIAQKIASCNHCGLCKNRKNTVPGFGVAQPLVMIIGEGPGAEEDAQGLPFVGTAGQLLDKMLASIQLSRNTNCFIGNIVKCRPPHNRDPLPEESTACASFLQAQIHVLKPKMILAVGRIAAQNLLGTTEGIGKLHGRFFDYPPMHSTSETFGASKTSTDAHEKNKYAPIPFMATYHPSALLRDSSYKKPTWDDLKLFRTQLETIVPHYAEQSANRQSDSSGDIG